MQDKFDYNNIDKIIKEYLGISEDNDTIDIKQLKKDIKKVCDKYANQDIDYILESDYIFGYAGDKYEYDTSYPLGVNYSNIEFIEDMNGIVVYKKKGRDK